MIVCYKLKKKIKISLDLEDIGEALFAARVLVFILLQTHTLTHRLLPSYSRTTGFLAAE